MVADEIRKFLEQEVISTRRVLLNIPRHMTMARLIRLPSTNEEEISKIVKIEALKFVPCADEEIVSSYRIIEKFDDGYSSVLVVAMMSAAVQKQVDVLKSAGVKDVEIIALGSESLLMWYLLAREKKDDNGVLVVNIDAHYVDMNIIDGEKLVFTRGIVCDGSENLLEEFQASMAMYQKSTGKPVGTVVLTGNTLKVKACQGLWAREKGLLIETIGQMEHMPVKLHDLDSSFSEKWSGIPPARRAGCGMKESFVADTGSSSFVELMGLSMKAKEICINLLPDAMAARNRLRSLKGILIRTAVLAVLVLVLIGGLLVKKLNDKAVYLTRINAEIARIEPQAAKTRTMLKSVKVIKEQMFKRPLSIDVVGDLSRLAPDGILLMMIDFERERSLTVRGTAPSLSDTLKYMNVLAGLPYLQDVKIRNVSKKKAEGGEETEFEITGNVIGGH